MLMNCLGISKFIFEPTPPAMMTAIFDMMTSKNF